MCSMNFNHLSISQHRYDAIVDWWTKLATDNPDLINFVTIGKSLEGRDQPAVHITASMDEKVKTIYFQCQIHASESYAVKLVNHQHL